MLNKRMELIKQMKEMETKLIEEKKRVLKEIEEAEAYLKELKNLIILE